MLRLFIGETNLSVLWIPSLGFGSRERTKTGFNPRALHYGGKLPMPLYAGRQEMSLYKEVRPKRQNHQRTSSIRNGRGMLENAKHRMLLFA